MKRDLSKLSNHRYDLLVIGGGIYGVSIARDAALRGLKVALVEKGDFGAATSFNSLKIAHGGLRYLQHLNFARMRESIRERTVLMRIAPHLVRPLPFLIPTYGCGLQSKQVLRMALTINDWVSFDRNPFDDPERRLPPGRVISKSEYLEIVPDSIQKDLSGGAVWHDCQIQNSERLLISVLEGAVEQGAEVANYIEVKDLLRQKETVVGAQAVDVFTGDKFDIQAKITVNAAGPWVQQILNTLGPQQPERLVLSKAMNLVCKRPLVKKYAVGLTSVHSFVDKHAVLNKGKRLLFLVPWHQFTLIGTTHTAYHGLPDHFSVTESEIESFIAEINAAYPGAKLQREDIPFVYGGMLPMNANQEEGADVSLQKRYKIIDHEAVDRVKGLLSVVGVKFTEARYVAEQTVNRVSEKIGGERSVCKTHEIPIHGGDIEHLGNYISQEMKKNLQGLDESVCRHLIHTYGTRYRKILSDIDEDPKLGARVSEACPVIKGEILHAVREGMAQTLSDVVFRRTELRMHGHPGGESLRACAETMALERGWDEAKVLQEVNSVEALFPS